jgi:hypothetical protein
MRQISRFSAKNFFLYKTPDERRQLPKMISVRLEITPGRLEMTSERLMRNSRRMMIWLYVRLLFMGVMPMPSI